MSVVAEGCVSEPGNFAFYAAHIGHNGIGSEVRSDLLSEADDAIHRGGDDHEVGTGHGGFGCGLGGVAPGLLIELQTHFGAACPDDDVLGQTTRAGSPGHGGAEKAGSEDGDLVEHTSLQCVNGAGVEP